MLRLTDEERPFAARRRELGLSLDRAAARLRISPRYLRQLERGNVALSWPLAHRMATEYGSSIDDLTRPTRAGGAGRGGRHGGTLPAPKAMCRTHGVQE
jgi:transcriptional regulator with XRE-family HTH domain